MPTAVGIVVLLFLRAVLGLLALVRNVVGELLRRLGRAYHAGYAIVPEGSKPGNVVGPDRFVVARHPISLPDWTLPGEVARIASVAGVRASMRRRGRWWEASSAIVVEILPRWVVFGPTGRLVVDVIYATLDVPDDRAAATKFTLDRRNAALIVYGDWWRSGLAAQIRSGTIATVRHRVVHEVIADVPDDGGEDEVEEAREAAFQARMKRWSGAIEATVHAAVAAALIDELDRPTVKLLSSDWQEMIAWEPAARIHAESQIERASGLARRAVRFIERHPSTGAVVTFMALLLVIVAIPPGIYVVIGVLVAALPIMAIRQAILIRDRIRLRVWAPRGDIDHAVPAARRVRRAMAAISSATSAIENAHLVGLLRNAEVWVALKGPPPSDPERTLAWLRGNAQVLPIDLRPTGDGVVVMAYTEAQRHRSADLPEPIAWTTRIAFRELAGHGQALDAVAILLDPGCKPASSIPRDMFSRFEGAAGASSDESLVVLQADSDTASAIPS